MVFRYAGRSEEAAQALFRAIRLGPDVADHHNELGGVLENLGRDGEAMAAYRQALSLDPRHLEAREQLGVLLLAYGHREEALDCFRAVARAVPDTTQGRLNQAKILSEERQVAELEVHLRETVALDPGNAEASRFLASVLRDQGRFAEAIPLLEKATEGSPARAATAYFDLAMSKKITPDDTPMLEQMRALIDYKSLPEVPRKRVHFALGKAYDDLGDYAAAMRHFDAGNRLAAIGRPFDRGQFGANINRLIASTPAAFFEERRAFGSDSELPVLILGMPRSGTTLVEQIVSSHPEAGGGDELPFWNRAAEQFARLGDKGATQAHLKRVAAEYEAVLRNIDPAARRVTDKLPGNFLWIGLFHLVFPRGRIVHCQRHPVDTCLSNYFTNFSAPMAFTYEKGHLAFYYRCYERLMAHWRAVLPPGIMLDVQYEELIADRERVTRRMVDFLGLDWNDACLRPEDNKRAVLTASSWQVRQPVYQTSTERWRRYDPWLGELAELLEEPRTIIPAQPTSDNPKLAAAAKLRNAGRFDEALAILQEALRESPHDPVLYSDLGSVCLLSNRVPSAIDCFERAIGLHPDFAAAHNNLGAALERSGRLAEAVASLRRAIELSPNMGPAYSRLGNLLQTLGEAEEAKTCSARAAELLTDPADRELEKAKLLLADGKTAEAVPLLRRVVALDHDNGLAHAMLGDVLGQMGAFPEAIALLRKATELDPERASAWHNIAVLTKITDADRALIERMEEMLGQPGRTETDRSLLHFALGKAYDDLHDHRRAITHYDEGNGIEHRRAPFDGDALAGLVDRTISTFTPTFLSRHASGGSDGERALLIVGMPRSGTTLAEQILSAHPCIGGGGELTFWADRSASVATQQLPAIAADYLRVLHGIAPDAERVTDKYPYNFFWMGLIHLALPRARFIHCRRDPIDTCLSIYFTRFALPQPFAYDRDDLVFYYRQYERLMAHWRAVLPSDRLLEIEYDSLTADPGPHMRRMVAFTGLDWDEACLAPERNAGIIRTASIWQARQAVYRGSVARWQRYEPWLGALAALR